MDGTVRIALLTGYLGAGKTTLLNDILANDRGIRAAVIVNDIGEVNIDAELIARGGMVAPEAGSLVPLTNGCICCTLKDDLAAQLRELAGRGLFSYIIIEASGVCEPMPIAHTIAAICEESTERGLPMALDNIIAVVDCARMRDEFEGGRALAESLRKEDDLAYLLVQQLEFCNTILLNKADLVTEEELEELEAIVRSLQREAKIFRTCQCRVDTAELLNTGRFDLERSLASAGWLAAVHEHEEHSHELHEHGHEHEEHGCDHEHGSHEHGSHEHDPDHDEDPCREHDSHHEHDDHWHGEHDSRHEHDDHHHGGHGHDHGEHGHHHDHGDHDHLAEFGITTFVYERRRPFSRAGVEALAADWPKGVIRCKGMIWYKEEPEMSYIFEQSGRQIQEKQSGPFLAAAPKEQQEMVLARFPEVRRNWDPVYGDRRIRLVFIGKDMDRAAIEAALENC